MDELEDTVGKLSLNAKEWRPGLGFSSNSEPSRQVSAGSMTSAGSSGGWNAVGGEEDRSNSQSSWGDSSQAIDVNGTHYFSTALQAEQQQQQQQSTVPNQNPHRHRLPRSTLRNSLSLPSEEYHYYRELSLYSETEMNPDDNRHKAVPPSFCRAFCLEPDTSSSSHSIRSSFGYPAILFRVTSTSDGNLYALRRIDSAMKCVNHTICQSVMQQWLSNPGGLDKNQPGGGIGGAFDHPGVVRFYKCFLSQRAVFFLHHYHAGAVTLKERFFSNKDSRSGIPLPESFIWSCLTQLVSAILAVHNSDLAVRTLQLNHILCTQERCFGASASSSLYSIPKVRLRINCVGIVDVLEFEARKTLEELQREDMRALGCLLLSMTTGTEVSVSDVYRNNSLQQQIMILNQYLGFVRQNYSRDLHSLIEMLLNPNITPPPIRAVAANMAVRVFEEMDGLHSSIDGMHDALMGVYESGRALRLMLKLAFVNERPEFGIDQRWSESGDCYVLKLFRDFVFHQADGAGRPAMDLGHVISSLNKLDAADEEKIVLTSRDGKNVLVVSYADVAFCLEKAYQELCSNSVPHPVVQ
ncbi:hypothetical protein HJC23_010497 [Cyclotella cryptica]|uniref:Protein kinase domain-containing protein n=1 Tax=Cyclotella cryptica TaxID=29204 RepID=A0ABD3QC92_9STRA|eukprot:CCRYP_007073-RA/>CCRYP_007073-RA protein AED:0.05 eAED:0.05 QI:211/1/1/1/0.75/0.8/5/366/579